MEKDVDGSSNKTTKPQKAKKVHDEQKELDEVHTATHLE